MIHNYQLDRKIFYIYIYTQEKPKVKDSCSEAITESSSKAKLV